MEVYSLLGWWGEREYLPSNKYLRRDVAKRRREREREAPGKKASVNRTTYSAPLTTVPPAITAIFTTVNSQVEFVHWSFLPGRQPASQPDSGSSRPHQRHPPRQEFYAPKRKTILWGNVHMNTRDSTYRKKIKINILKDKIRRESYLRIIWWWRQLSIITQG